MLAGVVGTMVFGAFLMLHDDNATNHGLCIPGVVDRGECNYAMSPLEYIRIHIGALNGLAALPTTAAMVFLFLVSLELLGLFRHFIKAPRGVSLSATTALPALFEIDSSQSKKLLKWFAIHEKRDPSLSFRS